MSDQGKEKSEEEIPEGMERRQRRVRKKRKATKGPSRTKEDAGRLFSKAKDLLIGMHEDDDIGHVDVAEQVRRLKQKKEDNRPLDDVWGTKKRSSSWLWIVLFGVIAAVVAVVIGFMMWADEEPIVDEDESLLKSDMFTPIPEPLGDGPLAWFNENSIEVIAQATKIIEIVNQSGPENENQVSRLTRRSGYRGAAPIDVERWGSPLLLNSLSGFQWNPKLVYSSEVTGSKKRGYLALSGKRENGEPYEVFLVNEENRVLLDWDASVGWSEKSIEQMVVEKPRKEIFLRCRLAKKPSYDQKFGKTDYSGYVLSGDEVDDFFFGYVNLEKPGGKAIERDLRLLLNYGSFISDEAPLVDQKVTLRVRFDDRIGEEGNFEIVEYLNDGWVTP